MSLMSAAWGRGYCQARFYCLSLSMAQALHRFGGPCWPGGLLCKYSLPSGCGACLFMYCWWSAVPVSGVSRKNKSTGSHETLPNRRRGKNPVTSLLVQLYEDIGLFNPHIVFLFTTCLLSSWVKFTRSVLTAYKAWGLKWSPHFFCFTFLINIYPIYLTYILHLFVYFMVW